MSRLFDRTDDWAYRASESALLPTGSQSLMCWYKPTGNQLEVGTVFSKGDAEGFMVRHPAGFGSPNGVTNTNVRLDVRASGNQVAAQTGTTASGPVVADTWLPIVGTYDSSNPSSQGMKLWAGAGGPFTASRSGAVGTNSFAFVVGAQHFQNTGSPGTASNIRRFIGGRIAHVVWLNRTANAGEVAQFQAGENPLAIWDEADFIGYWPLLTDGTDVVNGRDLTIVGATHSTDNPTVDDPPGGEDVDAEITDPAPSAEDAATVNIVVPATAEITDPAPAAEDNIEADSEAGLSADEFPGTALAGHWTVDDPRDDCTVSVADGRLSIAVPSGTQHDLWGSDNWAPRVVQALDEDPGDFEIVTRLDSVWHDNPGFRTGGLIVEGSGGQRIRVDVLGGDNQYRTFAASAQSSTERGSFIDGVLAGPSHLALARVGNQWTARYSFDGVAWTQLATWSETFTVTRVGLSAGNTFNNPAVTARFGYFRLDRNYAAPPTLYPDPLLTEGFPGTSLPADWADDSKKNATVTVDGQLELSFTGDSVSSARVHVDHAPVLSGGVAFRFRYASSNGLDKGFLVLALRGQGADFADYYSPSFGYLLEMNQRDGDVLMMRVADTPRIDLASPSIQLDGAYCKLGEWTYADHDRGSWHWCRLEVFDADDETWVRARVWKDGDAEPSTWGAEARDGVIDQPGRLFLAWGRLWNAGTYSGEDVEVDDVTVYELVETAPGVDGEIDDAAPAAADAATVTVAASATVEDAAPPADDTTTAAATVTAAVTDPAPAAADSVEGAATDAWSPPEWVTADLDGLDIVVDWELVTGAVAYDVQRETEDGPVVVVAAEVEAPPWTDVDPGAGRYRYRVRAGL